MPTICKLAGALYVDTVQAAVCLCRQVNYARCHLQYAHSALWRFQLSQWWSANHGARFAYHGSLSASFVDFVKEIQMYAA